MIPQFLRHQSVPSETYQIFMDNHRLCLSGIASKFNWVFYSPDFFLFRRLFLFMTHLVVGCWRGFLSGAKCRFAYAQLIPLPLTISCSSKSRLVLPSWFYLSSTGSPG